jgi:hypothetical protein
MVRTQIQLTTEQSEAVRRLARERGVSAAEIIRQSIDRYVRTGGRPSEEEVRRRALEVIGIARNGPGDLSLRHDAYFAEAIMGDDRLD